MWMREAVGETTEADDPSEVQVVGEEFGGAESDAGRTEGGLRFGLET